MSSNKALRWIFVAVATAALAGCATPSETKLTEAATVPTEQFKFAVAMKPEQLLLAPHPQGLSNAQKAAVYDLVTRWRNGPGGPIVVETPTSGPDATFQATVRVEEYLAGYGVREPDVEFRRYQADAQAPIRVNFPIYTAEIPKCGQAWDDLVRPKNHPFSNFGCATTANIAAMVANPADLVFAQEPTPFDAARRQNVLEKYRTGAITSSAMDASVSSKAVQ